jgi:hypothetical protein
MTREERRESLRDRYEKWWPVSAAREERIKGMLEKSLGKIVPYGMGALSTQRIVGSARENGFEPADPDLYSSKYNCFFEVTGPLKNYIHIHDALYVNPDKVENARRKFNRGYQTWLVHVLDRKGVREQLLSLAGDVLGAELRTLVSNYCLTEKARCKLGRLCARMASGKADVGELIKSIELFHKKGTLISPYGNEKTIVRCFLMDENFARRFGDNTTTFRGETFVQVPHDWAGIVSFRRMTETIRGRKR